MMMLSELLRDALPESIDEGTCVIPRDELVGQLQTAVIDWLSQQDTADAIYVAQTKTGVGPPLSAITSALIDMASL